MNVVWRQPSIWSCAATGFSQRVSSSSSTCRRLSSGISFQLADFLSLCLEARTSFGSRSLYLEFSSRLFAVRSRHEFKRGQNWVDHFLPIVYVSPSGPLFVGRCRSRFFRAPSKWNPRRCTLYRSCVLSFSPLFFRHRLNLSALECIQTRSLPPAKLPGPPKISF